MYRVHASIFHTKSCQLSRALSSDNHSKHYSRCIQKHKQQFTCLQAFLYRGSGNEIVSPLLDDLSRLLGEESMSEGSLSMRKPGSWGTGSAVSLLNIKTTVDMLGLLSGHCCTHNRPTWTDRDTWAGLQESFTDLSISSNIGLSSLYCLHAWKNLDHFLEVSLTRKWYWNIKRDHRWQRSMSHKWRLLSWNLLSPSLSAAKLTKQLKKTKTRLENKIAWRHSHAQEG